MNTERRQKALPLLLTFCIIVADQLSKAWIVSHIPENTVGYRFMGDFLAIVHVRNTAIAFSMGRNLPQVVKIFAFVVIPLVFLVVVAVVYASPKISLTTFQRWALALFMGGGIGNLIDRIFRSFRVVDFISVKVYGLFGFERWPTWNIADGSLVVSAFLLIIAFLLVPNERRNENDV